MKKRIIGGLSLALFLGGIFAFSVAQGKNSSAKEENLFYYDMGRDMKLEVSFYKKAAHISSKNLGDLKLKASDSNKGRRYINDKNNLVLEENQQKVAIFIGEKNVFRGELQRDDISKNIKELILTREIWEWESIIGKGENYLKPAKAGIFNLSFGDGKVFATTDCADFEGAYLIKEEKISIVNLTETKRFCDNRVGDKFIQALRESESLAFGKENEMVLFLKNNSGSMAFNKK